MVFVLCKPKHRRKVQVVSLILAAFFACFFIGKAIITQSPVDWSVRPPDFPAVLAVPEYAENIEYKAPSQTWGLIGTGIYSVVYDVDEPFPGTKALSFIHKHLTSNGWRRLKFSLMNPHWPRTEEWRISYDKKSGREERLLVEEWVDDHGQSISVFLSCHLSRGQAGDPDFIQVDMALHGVDSWKYRYLQQYRRIHRDEFDERADPNRLDPNTPDDPCDRAMLEARAKRTRSKIGDAMPGSRHHGESHRLQPDRTKQPERALTGLQFTF